MIRVDGESVTVARALAAALDRCIQGNRVRPGVALARVSEGGGILGLGAGHGDIRNADRASIVNARTEVGVHGLGGADRRDPRGELARHSQLIHRRVPDVVRG